MESKQQIPNFGSLFILGLINGIGWAITKDNLGLTESQFLGGVAATSILIAAYWNKHLA